MSTMLLLLSEQRSPELFRTVEPDTSSFASSLGPYFFTDSETEQSLPDFTIYSETEVLLPDSEEVDRVVAACAFVALVAAVVVAVIAAAVASRNLVTSLMPMHSRRLRTFLVELPVTQQQFQSRCGIMASGQRDETQNVL